MNVLSRYFTRFNTVCSLIPESLVALVSRIAIASVFWRSVQTKIAGWEMFGQALQFYNVSDSTFLLFQYEYGLPLLPPRVAAYAATTAEFFLPLLLVLGFATRFAALALLGMTAVIQIFVLPAGWPTHILWLAIVLYLIKYGAGALSLDNFVKTLH